ncbi:putative glycoside hydrolase family 76 protein [Phaeomoniella chlamydospora]|uniref:Mannan endo-1,6-alpha-mannosidase n=1 Tax=Phaeomoniella chlamydospora TaxID=158046 RepID=A0A0G2GE69_PHACM|nr:putative glycoside hydrolase family 76 protein [Phaeomoniella chlamydospora]
MKPQSILAKFTPLLLAAANFANAIDLDLSDTDNVKDVLATIAYDMMSYYSGNESGQTPGLLPGPCSSDSCYYWWEAGAMFGAMVNYWQYTGDTSYNDVVKQALLFQRGEHNNYNPANQSSDMGNDDQAFWAFSAMDAAESNFDAPGSDYPTWLSLVDAVFNFQASEWDDATCGGGIRWQVYSFGNGYNLKNSISDGGFFQLAARLARYTGNTTYADWAEKVPPDSPFSSEGNALTVWDNTNTDDNCTTVDHYLWTYNAGTMIAGSAYMYNYTNGSSTWQTRLEQLLEGAWTYFPSEYGSNTMSEIECEVKANCNNDQSSFKAYLSRWLGVTTLLAPFTASEIQAKLYNSSIGAAGQCVGGDNGRLCGRRWYSTTWDGSSGVGQQMAAMSVIGTQLLTQDMVPKSYSTGGTSTTNSSSEVESIDGSSSNPSSTSSITTKDKAGAAILTILVCVSTAAAAMFMILD